MISSLEPYLEGRRKNVLLVEDSAATLLFVSKMLKSLGFNVLTAKNGIEALEVLYTEDISIIVSDWEMPVMDGIELCKEIRKRFPEERHYILILTANIQRDAIKIIFDVGADDYITKPVSKTVLEARLKGGLRIVAWQDDLIWFNNELEEKQRLLNAKYSKIRDDLIVAESVQRRYLPSEHEVVNDIEVCGYFEPAFHTSGDIYNFVPINDDELVLFSVDVSGHGIASSLLAVTIAESICIGNNPQPLLLCQDTQSRKAQSPACVISELNNRFCNGSTDHYFTINYCVVNSKTNKIKFCQAGHPPILVVNEDGTQVELGDGGLPVGMLENVGFQDREYQLLSGSRIYLFSDGIPEAEDHLTEQYGINSMLSCLRKTRPLSLKESLTELVRSARAWQADRNFADDVSILGFQIP